MDNRWRGKQNCVCGGQLEWMDAYSGHVERVKNMKSYMKITTPRKINETTRKAKCEAMKKCIFAALLQVLFPTLGNQREIQSQNLILLGKILRIDTPQTKAQNNPILFNTKNLSLNTLYRKRIYQKITNENRFIISRLTSVQSVYCKKKWDSEHSERMIRIRNISHNFSNL